MFNIKIYLCIENAYYGLWIHTFYDIYVNFPGAFTPPLNYYRAILQVDDPERGMKPTKLTVPVLSIFGTGDKYLSVAAEKGGRDFVENFQSVYLDGVSHWSPEQKPAEINKHIDNYLKTNF